MSPIPSFPIHSVSIIFQTPRFFSQEYTSWSFYSSSHTPEEMMRALCTPEIMIILKKAVYAVFTKQQNSYGAEFYDRNGLVTEVLVLVIDRILDRKGLRLPPSNVRLDFWFYKVFENAAKDVLRSINNERARTRKCSELRDKDGNTKGFLEEFLIDSEITAYEEVYQKDLDVALEHLIPDTILSKENKISPNRILVFFLLYIPEKVTYSHFAEATNYSRTLAEIWALWTEGLHDYLAINRTDTTSKKYSRAYLCFLLRGNGYTSKKSYKNTDPKAFNTARETLAKTIQRAEEDTFRLIVLRAAKMEAVDGELFQLISKIATPHFFSGPQKPFLQKICQNRHNENILARLLFSTKTTLKERLEDERNLCQKRFSFFYTTKP